MAVEDASGITYQPTDNGLTTMRQAPTPENLPPVTSGNVDLNQMRQTPVTVKYPSGHIVQFPSEAHANEHAASVWNQLKSGWNQVKNFKGLDQPDEGDAFGNSVIDHVGKWHNELNNTLQEAGAELGRKPAELLSGIKNLQAYMPSVYGQKPNMEAMEDTAKREHPILSGVGEGAGKFAGTMLAPENIAIMATMPAVKAVPLLSKALTVAFAADMSSGAIRDAKNVVANWPKMTAQQRTAALTSGSLQTVLAGLATIHAVGSEGKLSVPAELKGESGEMTVPGTGDRQMVGTAKGAEDDTRYFNEAKAENPDKSLSDWMRIAQDKKLAAGKPPVRPLSAADQAAAADAPEVNAKGQKLGVKPIDVSGKPLVVDKSGPDFNAKGQRLGVPPPVEDIGGKVRAEMPPMPRGERRARTRTPQEVADTAYFRQAVNELGQDADDDAITQRINELKSNRVVPPTSAGQGILQRLLTDEEGSMRIPFTGNPDQGELFPGGEVAPSPDEEKTPIWYSHANDTISNQVKDNMSGDQIRGLLINNGVTPDEMHAAGLNEYLSGKGKVSKTALQQHMLENQIRLHDMNFGHFENNPETAKKIERYKALGENQSEQERAIFRDVDNGASTRHADSFLDLSEFGQKNTLEAMKPEARQNMLQYLNTLQGRIDTAQDITGLEVRLNPEETTRANGRATYDVVDPTNNRVRYTSGIAGVDQYLNEEINGDSSGKYANGSSRYAQWQIGKQWENQGGLGAKDYTEKLMMLPESNKLTKAYADNKAKSEAFEKEMAAKYADSPDFWSEAMSPEEKSQYLKLEADKIASREAAKNQTYRHNHWSDPAAKNVVAFSRYGTLPQFTDKPTMMLHELQSDWNTDIKHSGYVGEREDLDQKIQELTEKKASRSTETNTFAATLREKGEAAKLQDKVEGLKARAKAGDELSKEEKTDLSDSNKRLKEIMAKQIGPSFSEQDQKDLDTAVARRQFLEENAGKPNVKPPQPKAPLLNDWHEVGLKRMLREMTDNGFKRMVWPTGEAAADLYGVHSHIKEIRWNPNTGQIDLVQHDGQVKPQNIEPTTEGLMKGLELPRPQAEKLAKSVTDFKAEQAAKGQRTAETPTDEDEEDEDDDRPTEEQYRNQLYDNYANSYGVDTETPEPQYEIWHDGNLIEGNFETRREAKKALAEWWEEEHPEHDIETGEYKGELEEGHPDYPGDLEEPEIREEEGEPMYVVRSQDGETLDSFDSERAAERYRDRLIDDDVNDAMNNASEDDYKPDEPPKPPKPKIPESEHPKLEGMDLHFGGKLHRLLYDEMVPRFLNKYLKKWGASVSKIDVPGAAPPSYKYVGPDVDTDDLKNMKLGDSGQEVSTNVQEMRNRIVERMENEHKTFSQVVNDMQEEPHFDRAYEQRTQRTDKQTLSIYEKEALNQLVEHFNGKIEKTPGTKKFWQIESTPQMERALKTKPQRISQMAAPKVSNQQQEQIA